MSFEECDGQVVLTMSKSEHSTLLLTLGMGIAALNPEHPMLSRVFNLLNTLNSGKPNYRPYQTGEKKS
jgi:hypothetical protein